MSRRGSDTVKTWGVIIGAILSIGSVLKIGFVLIDDFAEVQESVAGLTKTKGKMYRKLGNLETRVSVIEAISEMHIKEMEKKEIVP